jgi:hypothetical protein
VISSGDEDASAGGGLDLEVGVPLNAKTFLDMRLPIGMFQGVAIGNPSVSLRHVYTLTEDATWLGLSAGLGLPMLQERSSFAPAPAAALISRGLWDVQDFWANSMPVRVGGVIEAYGSTFFAFRLMADLTLLPPVGDNDFELATQHAAEFQFGRAIGGGLRVQGVALPTFDDTDVDSFLEGDLYQLSVEPFFAYDGEQLFARAGILMPLDPLLGPAFVESWAFRLSTGFHVD